MEKRITDLPTRYEPLINVLGENAKTTLLEQKSDLTVIKRLLARMKSSGQGKIIFIFGSSGSGKTTFVHSIETFLSDEIYSIVDLPPEHKLSLQDTPKWISSLPKNNRITVVNFDAREAPSFDEKIYRSFLVQLNSIIRTRNDILIVWPINDMSYGEAIVEIIEQVGGKSPFGKFPIYHMEGLGKDQYIQCLTKILQVANWNLEDAALGWDDVEKLVSSSNTVGSFLDEVQELVAERFDIDNIGVELPNITFVLTSNRKDIKNICRGLRRADSYYVEASRLMMYTKKSNVSEWWSERSKNQRTSLPYIVALFNAQLITVSGSGVVHSIIHFGNDVLNECTSKITANMGNAKRVIESSELYKYSLGHAVDNREYGLAQNENTQAAYSCIQKYSKKQHKNINKSIMKLVKDAGGGYKKWKYEHQTRAGLISDIYIEKEDKPLCLEFHHKAETECTYNKVSIYLLEKLKEYAVNYNLTPR